MTRYKFDDAQCLDIWHQYDQERLSTADLAKIWGCTGETITRCIYRAGGKLRDAAALQVSNKQRKLTDEQEKLAVELYESGKTQKQIGAELGVSSSTVKDIFRRLGFKPRSSAEANRLSRGMSDEQRAEAVRLYTEDGWSTAQIGGRLGFAGKTICSHLRREGLLDPIRFKRPIWFGEALQMRESGMTTERIAAAVGVSAITVRRHFDCQGVKRRSLRALSPSLELEAVKMYIDDGESSVDIGAHFGVSHKAILNLLNRHGIKRRRPGDALQTVDAQQQQEIARLYQSGKSSVAIAAQFSSTPSTICKILGRCGIEIRDSDNPSDTVQHVIDGTGRFEGEARECGFYVAGLVNHAGYCKAGIAYDYGHRARISKGEYSGEPELELRFRNRQEAYLLEQAVLDATRANRGCPEELQGWAGCTEVRGMGAADLADIAIRLSDELEELGLWEFAIRYVPMTASQVVVCQMRAEVTIA